MRNETYYRQQAIYKMRVSGLASKFWSFNQVLYRGMRTRLCKTRTLHIAVRLPPIFEKIRVISNRNIYICDMVTKSYIEKKLQRLKPYLSRNYNVSRIGYFGSFSRNEQTEKSDIDILVEFSKRLVGIFLDFKKKYIYLHFVIRNESNSSLKR